MEKPTIEALVKAVRAHALENYNKDGWDFVVECYEDTEIAEVVQGASSETAAIKLMKAEVREHHARRKEIQSCT